MGTGSATTGQAALAAAFIRALVKQRSTHAALQQTAELAAKHLPGAAAVTIIGPYDAVNTLSADTLALAADRVQHRHRQAPRWKPAPAHPSFTFPTWPSKRAGPRSPTTRGNWA